MGKKPKCTVEEKISILRCALSEQTAFNINYFAFNFAKVKSKVFTL